MKWSRLNLIGERLESYAETRTGFMAAIGAAIKSNRSARLQITMPEYEYLRAEVYAADLRKKSGMHNFDVGDIIALLFEDFMDQVREEQTTHAQLIEGIRNRMELFKQEKPKEELKQVGSNHWQLLSTTPAPQIRTQTMLQLEILLPRQEAIRAEVLLYDLNATDPSFRISLEQLITLLTMDFIREIKNGNGRYFTEVLLYRVAEQHRKR